MLDSRKCPCRYCKDRHEGCHSESCPHGWPEWEANKLRQYEENSLKLLQDQDYSDYMRRRSRNRFKRR